VTVLYRRYRVKPYLSNPIGAVIEMPKVGAYLTSLARSVERRTMVTSAHIHFSVLVVLVPMHLAHWTVQSTSKRQQYKKIHVEECLSFPETQKRYFKLQPKPMKFTCDQAAASCPSTSEISIQTDSVPPVPDNDGLKVCPYQSRMQLKPVVPPKIHRPINLKNSPYSESF
jgi:hypothetical protein